MKAGVDKALLAALVLPGCFGIGTTRVTFPDGTSARFGGNAEDVAIRTPGGGSIDLGKVGHAEEIAAAGDAAEKLVKPVARSMTFRKAIETAGEVAGRAFDRATEADTIEAARAGDEAALDAMIREQEIEAASAATAQ